MPRGLLAEAGEVRPEWQDAVVGHPAARVGLVEEAYKRLPRLPFCAQAVAADALDSNGRGAVLAPSRMPSGSEALPSQQAQLKKTRPSGSVTLRAGGSLVALSAASKKWPSSGWRQLTCSSSDAPGAGARSDHAHASRAIACSVIGSTGVLASVLYVKCVR